MFRKPSGDRDRHHIISAITRDLASRQWGSLRSAAAGETGILCRSGLRPEPCCSSAGARTHLSAPGRLVGRPVCLQEIPDPRVCFSSTWNGSQIVSSDLFVLRGGKTSSLEEQSLEVSAPPFPWVRPRGIVGCRRPLQGRAVVQATCGIYTYKKEQVAFVFKKLSKPTLPKTSVHILLLSTLSRHEVLSTQCVLHWWAHLCVHVPRLRGLRLPAVLMAPSPRLVLCTSLGSAQGQQRWGHRSPRAWEGKSTTSP